MRTALFLSIAVLFVGILPAQTKIDDDLSPALLNAKKGIYWALTNIPIKKTKIENDLVANDKLYASVKLQKEIGGIRIESTGFSESISITIIVYRSYDNLKKDGYIKKIEEPEIE
ncbi:MAG: hypothetical protein HXY50_10275 [Ignavibacteriaceae bacterium]|nr:hypothetical protein [Ignavibacteriaceae bacterium]